MKKYLLLFGLLINVIYAMDSAKRESFTDRLNRECAEAWIKNKQKGELATQPATQAVLEESHIQKIGIDFAQMSFTERLEFECKKAKEANRKKTQLDAQVAQKAQEQRHQISLVDTENIEAYYSDCTAISIAKVMSNKVFNGYLVEYTDKHRRRMRDFINCIKLEQGSQLVRIAINIVS